MHIKAHSYHLSQVVKTTKCE